MGHSTHIKSLENNINSIVCDQGQQSGAATLNVKHPNSIAASKRLGLRYYRREDIASIFESYTGDLGSAKFLARLPHTEIEQTENILKTLSIPESMGLAGKCIWVVDAIREGRAIGLVTIVKSNESMIVHFGIGRPYRGRGYAAEVVGLSARHLLAEDHAIRVNTFTDVENFAAQVALEKAGFIFTKRAEKFYQAPQLSGEYRDVFHYEFRG